MAATGLHFNTRGVEQTIVTDPTLDTVEQRLEEANERETEDAVATLETARKEIATLESDPDIDESRREAIADRIDQRLREVTDRDAYDSDLGAAMNPEDEDAP